MAFCQAAFVYLAVLGAAAGSFAGVLVARLPRLESVIAPASHCDGCARQLRWFENIPIASYVVMGGRCRTCRVFIGLRPLALELMLATLFVALGVRLQTPWELVTWLVAAPILVALTYIDLDYYWLPDSLVASLAVWAVAASFLPGRLGPAAAALGLLPALGLWLFGLLYARAFGKEGLGLGDIKLLAALGLFVGAKAALALLILACLQGATLGSLMLWVGGRGAPKPAPPALADDDWQPDAHAVPFGPFLSLATFELLLVPEIIERGHAMFMQISVNLASKLL